MLDKLTSIRLFPYQLLTYYLSSFIVGVLLSSLFGLNWAILLPDLALLMLLILFAIFINFLLRNDVLVFAGWAIIFILSGAITFSWQETLSFCNPKSIDQNSFKGLVIADPVRDFKDQELIIETALGECPKTRLLLRLPLYPPYSYGDELSFSGNLQKPGIINGFDYAKYLKPKRISYLVQNPSEVGLQGHIKTIWTKILEFLYKAKNLFENVLSRSLAEPESSLGVGILTGKKSNIPDDLKDNLNTAGLTHIIALSGFNVTIIIIALTGLLAGLFNRRWIFIIGSVLVLIFIIMTGASASVVRAGIFSMLVLWGQTIGRRAHQTNLLLLAATIMLIFNPFLLYFDMGFQLSFLAFAGLIYFSPPVGSFFERSRLRIFPDFFKKPLIETLSAQIMVFPLIAFAFGRVSLISPISNLLVLWILPLAMLLVFICGTAGLMLYPLGRILALFAWPVLAYVIEVASISARLPWASVEVNKYNTGLIIALYAIIGLIYYLYLARLRKWRKRLQNLS